jgi:hypothetical protein
MPNRFARGLSDQQQSRPTVDIQDFAERDFAKRMRRLVDGEGEPTNPARPIHHPIPGFDVEG